MKIYILKNPKGIVKSAQINIHDNGYSTLVVGLIAPFTDVMGTYKGLNGAKIGFGIQFYKGAKWEEDEN